MYGSAQLERRANRLRLPRTEERRGELFRRAKKVGVIPWGPSHPWADGSSRLLIFATVLGLMLVSLAKIALRTNASARWMMEGRAAIKVTLVKTKTGAAGRRPTSMLATGTHY